MNNIIIEEQLKECTLCHVAFPVTKEHFGADKKGKYGLSSRCKTCLKKLRESKKDDKHQYDAIRREDLRDLRRKQSSEYYWNNIDKKKEYDRRYRIENKSKRKEQKRSYYYTNREYCLTKNKENVKKNKEHYIKYRMNYYLQNKELLKKKAYIWRTNNKDKFNINCQRRKARKKKVESNYSEKDWINCKRYFNNKCAYCGKEEILTQDHFIPLVKDGEYTVNNIVPACKSCNSSKQDKDFEFWYQLTPFYSECRKKRIYKYLGYNEYVQQLALFK